MLKNKLVYYFLILFNLLAIPQTAQATPINYLMLRFYAYDDNSGKDKVLEIIDERFDNKKVSSCFLKNGQSNKIYGLVYSCEIHKVKDVYQFRVCDSNWDGVASKRDEHIDSDIARFKLGFKVQDIKTLKPNQVVFIQKNSKVLFPYDKSTLTSQTTNR